MHKPLVFIFSMARKLDNDTGDHDYGYNLDPVVSSALFSEHEHVFSPARAQKMGNLAHAQSSTLTYIPGNKRLLNAPRMSSMLKIAPCTVYCSSKLVGEYSL
jgi:hypothetical protein